MRWWQEAVFYQIYPRSFLDSNGDGIGDIRGIIEKLDYLGGSPGSLGVDALWISPFFPSPMKDFGYDIADYRGVDRIFGDLSDFSVLLREAHRRGIRVVIDLVINHTSDRHPWFIEASSSKDDPKHGWYIWRPMSAGKPNNWVSLFELKSAWWPNETTGEYFLGTFTRDQPEVDWRNQALKQAMYDVVRFWLNLGADGYRMDVCTAYIKDERFRSNPFKFNLSPDLFQNHIYDRNRPEVHGIFREIRTIADSFGSAEGDKERVLIGETHGRDAALAASCLGTGEDELHLAFNFDFLFQPWGARNFARAVAAHYASLPPGGWPNFTLSNHDQLRAIYRHRAGGLTQPRAKLAAAMLLTLSGTPFIYYGEELGMTCFKPRKSALRDPLGVRTWPFWKNGRDPERTPMQWTAGENAGFSKADPWLPVNPDLGEVNVERESADPLSMLSHYRNLLRLRRDEAVLRTGIFVPLSNGEGGVFSYRREAEGTGLAPGTPSGAAAPRSIAVYLNFDGKPREARIDRGGIVLSGSTHRAVSSGVSAGKERLDPCEVLIVAESGE
jgi:alpha-glucosidase